MLKNIGVCMPPETSIGVASLVIKHIFEGHLGHGKVNDHFKKCKIGVLWAWCLVIWDRGIRCNSLPSFHLWIFWILFESKQWMNYHFNVIKLCPNWGSGVMKLCPFWCYWTTILINWIADHTSWRNSILVIYRARGSFLLA